MQARLERADNGLLGSSGVCLCLSLGPTLARDRSILRVTGWSREPARTIPRELLELDSTASAPWGTSYPQEKHMKYWGVAHAPSSKAQEPFQRPEGLSLQMLLTPEFKQASHTCPLGPCPHSSRWSEGPLLGGAQAGWVRAGRQGHTLAEDGWEGNHKGQPREMLGTEHSVPKAIWGLRAGSNDGQGWALPTRRGLRPVPSTRMDGCWAPSSARQ